MCIAPVLGQARERRAGIGHHDEPRARVGLAQALAHEVVEVRVEEVRLERRAGLAGHDEQRSIEVESRRRTSRSAPIVESRTVSAGNPGRGGKVRDRTSGHRLEPPMPSSATCVKARRSTSYARACRRPTFPIRCSATLTSRATGLVAPSRERRVARPEAPYLAGRPPVLEGRRDRRLDTCGSRRWVESSAEPSVPARRRSITPISSSNAFWKPATPPRGARR